MAQSHVYKVIPASKAAEDEAALNAFAKEGWSLLGGTGGNLYLVKALAPHETGGRVDPDVKVAKVCANCGSFETVKDTDGVGRCPEWNLLVEASGGCGKFKTRGMTEKSIPDEVSAWHWTPRTEIGEKRIEAITTQGSGVASPEHKHRVMVIRAKDGSVVRGKTDVVNGHDHLIKFMGMVEEADGHGHTFLLPQES
jgi:hypothetical protein